MPLYGQSLPDLDNYFSDKSYVEKAVRPTQLDRELYDTVSKESKIQTKLPNMPGGFPALPHLSRWLKHISSFTFEERMSFNTNFETSTVENPNRLHSSSLDDIAFLDNRVCNLGYKVKQTPSQLYIDLVTPCIKTLADYLIGISYDCTIR